MIARLRTQPVVAGVVATVLAVVLTGCAPSGAGSKATVSPVDKGGWSRVDQALPPAAGKVARIGESGPSRFSGGGLVVVNLWSSSCAPCRTELPMLERLQRGQGVRVVGVSRDNVVKYARAEIARRGVTFPNYSDASGDFMWGLKKVLPPNAVPTTILVQDGRVRAVHVGKFASYDELGRTVTMLAR